VADQNETYTITLTLNDQVSDSLTKVASAWDNLQKKMKESQGEGEKGFAGIRGEADRLNMAMGGLNAALMSFGTSVSSHLGKSLGELKKHGGGIEEIQKKLGGLGKAFEEVGKTGNLAGLGRALMGVGEAAAGMATRVATAATSFPALAAAGSSALISLSRSYAEAFRASENFKASIGASGPGIAQFKRVAEMLGDSTEEANQHLQRFAGLVRDLPRGEYSQLYQALSKHGQEGMRVANALREMQLAGADTTDTIRELLKETAHWSKQAQWELAQQLGIPLKFIQEGEEAQKKAIAIYKLSAEAHKKLKEDNKALEDQVNKFNQTWQNFTDRVQKNVDTVVVPALGRFMTAINNSGFDKFLDSLPIENWAKTAGAALDTVGAHFKEMNDAVKTASDKFMELQTWIREHSLGAALTGSKEPVNQQITGYLEKWWAEKQKTIVEPEGSPAYNNPEQVALRERLKAEEAARKAQETAIRSRAETVNPIAEAAGGEGAGGGLPPGLQGGGPVTAGKHYLVGENGPELFMSHEGGAIHPLQSAAEESASQRAPFAARATEQLPILLQEGLSFDRDQTGFLREIRDVMTWLREQIEGKQRGVPGTT